MSDLMYDSKWHRNKKVLMLCHKYEYKSLSFTLDEDKYFDSIESFILSKSSILSSRTLTKITESNRYSFGKLYLHL